MDLYDHAGKRFRLVFSAQHAVIVPVVANCFDSEGVFLVVIKPAVDFVARDAGCSAAHVYKPQAVPQMLASQNFFGGQPVPFAHLVLFGTSPPVTPSQFINAPRHWNEIGYNPRSFSLHNRLYAITRSGSSFASSNSLPEQDSESGEAKDDQPPFGPFEGCVPFWRFVVGVTVIGLAYGMFYRAYRTERVFYLVLGHVLGEVGSVIWLGSNTKCSQTESGDTFHSGTIVLQKYLDKFYYCSTVIDMANVLSKDKQVADVSALAEGSSIRSIERMTGINRNTIMNLGVRVGQGCTALLDAKMRDLPCRYLQFDEVWGFIGKKERHVRPDDDPQFGDVWTFCAIDADTKLVPSFKCGKRDLATARAFVEDAASRMENAGANLQRCPPRLRGFD